VRALPLHVSAAEFELQSDMPYLLIPMTYRRNVSMSFVVEVSEPPSEP
jgi:hypothetical protein